MLVTEIVLSICLNFYNSCVWVPFFFFFLARNAPSKEDNILSIELKINISLISIFFSVLKCTYLLGSKNEK